MRPAPFSIQVVKVSSGFPLLPVTRIAPIFALVCSLTNTLVTSRSMASGKTWKDIKIPQGVIVHDVKTCDQSTWIADAQVYSCDVSKIIIFLRLICIRYE